MNHACEASAFGSASSERIADRICPRTRVIGSASKRGSVSASRSSATLSSRVSLSIRAETEKASLLVENEKFAARSCACVENATESSSPAPSSSIADRNFAAPACASGSVAAPPLNAISSATIGMACSSTSQ